MWIQKFMGIHLMDAEIFQSEARWCIEQPTLPCSSSLTGSKTKTMMKVNYGGNKCTAYVNIKLVLKYNFVEFFLLHASQLLTRHCHWCTLETHWITTKMLGLVFSNQTENKPFLFPQPHTQPIYRPHSLLMTPTASPLTAEVTWATGHWSPLCSASVEVRISPLAWPTGQSSKCNPPPESLQVIRPSYADGYSETDEREVMNLLPSPYNGHICCE